MKKILSLLLVLVMILGITPIQSFADIIGSDLTASVPVIYITGDSRPLAYDNGQKTFSVEKMLSIFSDSEEGAFATATFNILYPFLLEGIAFNKWDNYYDAVYKEFSDVYEPIKLDENGEPNDGCGLPQWMKDDLANAVKTNRCNAQGRYAERSYFFYYDWRLDPIYLADELNDYIEGVKKATGHDKVIISAKCLGCNVLAAYIDKYSTDSLKGVGIDVATTMGSEFLSGTLSGDFGIDGNGVSRLLSDLTDRYDDLPKEIIKFASSTFDLLENTGVLDTLGKVAREQLYSKIEYGVISALARAVFLTYPGYWGMVSVDKFDKALTYVFGSEGDEKRETYKGLIEKIVNYNEKIKKNVIPIMKKLETGGVNICIISKYGSQMVPSLKESDCLGDEFVSVTKSSYGATTSTIYTTLSDEYIAAQTEKGLGRYISPDKQIDASTCLFPDYTWFFKGVSHGFYITQESDILMTVTDADTQMTVDDFDLTQFIVYDYQTHTAQAMTPENCKSEVWEADEKIDRPSTKKEKLTSFLTSLFRWLKDLFVVLINHFRGKA